MGLSLMVPAAGLAATAVLLAMPALAVGDIPGNASTRTTLTVGKELTRGVLDTSPDADWYRVRLEKGQDYAVRITLDDYSRGSVTLRDSGGRAINRVVGNTDGDDGFEFRAPTTGIYFLDVSGELDYPDIAEGYLVGVTFDCRDAVSTKCSLQLGRSLQGTSGWVADWDRLAVSLDAARRYDFAVVGPEEAGLCFAQLLDARGAVVARAPSDYDRPAQISGFRPARSGKHYLRVNCSQYDDYGASYRVSMTRK